jgi:PBP1b-binding outer membrane lipoprotein LpoB
MTTAKARIGAIIIPMLLLAACGEPEPKNISEDQLNHFSGITEHDHGVPATGNANSATAAPENRHSR